jgi:hypothetical protein
MVDDDRAEGAAGRTIRGIVRGLNFAPRGEVEGLLLDVDGATVQVNFPRDRADAAAQLVGREVAIDVGPEPAASRHPQGDHPVHQFLELREGGDAVRIGLEAHDGREPIAVRGTIARLNYAKHGEPNGVVLDSGDFIHLKPEGMKQVGLRVGQEVEVKGRGAIPAPRAAAVEADVVNGVEITRP